MAVSSPEQLEFELSVAKCYGTKTKTKHRRKGTHLGAWDGEQNDGGGAPTGGGAPGFNGRSDARERGGPERRCGERRGSGWLL
jgi:hypothetical protein